MKIVVLNGSPRKGGNTEIMTQAFAEAAPQPPKQQTERLPHKFANADGEKPHAHRQAEHHKAEPSRLASAWKDTKEVAYTTATSVKNFFGFGDSGPKTS